MLVHKDDPIDEPTMNLIAMARGELDTSGLERNEDGDIEVYKHVA